MFNRLAKEIHDQNVRVGWWDDWPLREDRHLTSVMLVVTELSEAAEGVRRDRMDDHLPHHPMFDVELADAAIRLLDMAGAYNCDLSDTLLNGWRDFYLTVFRNEAKHGRNRLTQLGYVCSRIVDIRLGARGSVERTFAAVYWLAHLHDINLWAIIEEKVEYNKTRADHQRANRAKGDGKKF